MDSSEYHVPASPEVRPASSARSAGLAIAVFIVAGVPVYAEALGEALRREPSIRAVATTRTLDEALARAQQFSPDVILVDTVSGNGTQTVQALAAEVPAAGILALGVEVDQAMIAYVEAGAAAFVPRDASLAELVRAVESLARGEIPFSEPLAGSLVRRVQRSAAERQPERLAEHLTPREHQILDLIEQGSSNKQIAASLSIAPTTVKNHVHNILEKLHVARRGEAVAALRRRT
jgi:two-component system nitrate/nitrite response regulator NarL